MQLYVFFQEAQRKRPHRVYYGSEDLARHHPGNEARGMLATFDFAADGVRHEKGSTFVSLISVEGVVYKLGVASETKAGEWVRRLNALLAYCRKKEGLINQILSDERSGDEKENLIQRYLAADSAWSNRAITPQPPTMQEHLLFYFNGIFRNQRNSKCSCSLASSQEGAFFSKEALHRDGLRQIQGGAAGPGT